MPSLDEMVTQLVSEFRNDPRNKVFVSQTLMIESIRSESGKDISAEEFASLVESYKDGSLDDDTQVLWDAAMFVCGQVAKQCFSEDPDDEDAEVDYEISFVDNSDGSVSAELRPN